MSLYNLPPADQAMSRRTAIVGIGETDYADDYGAARAARASGERMPGKTPEELARTAFERALADSGLERGDIDGLFGSFLYGGPATADLATQLGIAPRYMADAFGLLAGPLPQACAAILSGQCDTIALVYAVASRSIGRVFGGKGFGEDAHTPQSYYYYHPWGWSSQAAHWAMSWQHYRHQHGKADGDLGALAIQLRHHAQASPQSIMQADLTMDAYLASRFIVKPLRLLDMCLVNDGAVCLILRRSDLARDMPHDPVALAGWGENIVKRDKLDMLVRERLYPCFQDAGRQTLDMAGLSIDDVGHFEAYDACRDGQLTLGGRLPTNMSGGMISGSYMHGWSHVAEIVRQLRHEAGPRQIAGVEASLFSLAQTDRVHPLLFTRGV